MSDKKDRVPMHWKKNMIMTVVLTLVTCVVAAALYYNHLLNLINRPEESAESGTQTVSETVATSETSPEDTWPQIVSEKNITNILLVGQAAREGETALIADSMILCSINRETNTLTLTSIMRDLRLVWPEFRDIDGNPHWGHNRVNMAYNMGYKWAGRNSQGGMKLLSSIIEHNFGVEVDHSIEINFDLFVEVVDMLGGVTVDLREDEYAYLVKNAKWTDDLAPGSNTLNGYHALCYARMRKVGHGDYERTERQRRIITQLVDQLRQENILEILELFEKVLPGITTDMTNREMTNYAFEFIPMLKNLNVQSQRIPFDGTYWTVTVNIEGQPVPDQQIDCNVKENGRLLRQSLGMEEPDVQE